MPKGKAVRYVVVPRDVPVEKAARRLHLTHSQFEAVKYELFDRGFPRPDQTTGMYDLEAIEAWMNQRSGLSANGSLTPATTARDARDVFNERVRRLANG